jgi:hypothetical protein
MQYGKESKTVDLGNGLIETDITEFQDFRPRHTKRYEQRIKISDEQEEISEYLKFRRATKYNQLVEFRVEKRGKSTYCVKIWTE